MLSPAKNSFVIFFSLLLLLVQAPATANGWEHHAIPLVKLFQTLQSEETTYRARAAVSLGVKGDRGATPVLVEHLQQGEPAREVRSAIYLALGRIKDPLAFDTLLAAMRDEQDEEQKADAAFALGQLGEKEVVVDLLNTLKTANTAYLRHAVIVSLGQFSTDDSINELIKMLNGGNKKERRLAIASLGRTRSDHAATALHEVLQDSDDETETVQIIRALGEVRSPNSQSYIEKILQHSSSDLVKTQAVIALGAISDGSAVPTLLEVVATGSRAQKYFALNALAETADPATVPQLNQEIRNIVQAITGVKAQADLQQAIDDLTLLKQALQALINSEAGEGFVAYKSVLLNPIQLTTDSSPALKANALARDVKRLAIFGLGYVDGGEARDLLLDKSLLENPDDAVRASVARSLAVNGENGVVDALIKLTGDKSPHVRWTAADMLGRLQAKSAFENLKRLLGDTHSEVRRTAASGLGLLGNSSATLTLLETAKNDSSERVRNAATEALRLLEGS